MDLINGIFHNKGYCFGGPCEVLPLCILGKFPPVPFQVKDPLAPMAELAASVASAKITWAQRFPVGNSQASFTQARFRSTAYTNFLKTSTWVYTSNVSRALFAGCVPAGLGCLPEKATINSQTNVLVAASSSLPEIRIQASARI